MTIDLEIPSLPKGYFFRITSSSHQGCVEVELRKKHFLGSSVKITDVVRASKERIHFLMQEMACRLRDTQKATVFHGDYPPKTLK